MKIYSKILAGLLVQGLFIQGALGQTNKSSDSVFVKAQIKPKFSEMSDYGLPVSRQDIHEFPGGKTPVSNQINADGTVRISRTGEITAPVETFRIIEKQKQPDSDPGLPNKSKRKK